MHEVGILHLITLSLFAGSEAFHGVESFNLEAVMINGNQCLSNSYPEMVSFNESNPTNCKWLQVELSDPDVITVKLISEHTYMTTPWPPTHQVLMIKYDTTTTSNTYQVFRPTQPMQQITGIFNNKTLISDSSSPFFLIINALGSTDGSECVTTDGTNLRYNKAVAGNTTCYVDDWSRFYFHEINITALNAQFSTTSSTTLNNQNSTAQNNAPDQAASILVVMAVLVAAALCKIITV